MGDPAPAEAEIAVVKDHGLPGGNASDLLREHDAGTVARQRLHSRGDIGHPRSRTSLYFDRAAGLLAGNPVHALGDELLFLECGRRADGDAMREWIHLDDVCALRRAADLQTPALPDREAVVAVVTAEQAARHVDDLPTGFAARHGRGELDEIFLPPPLPRNGRGLDECWQ